MYWLLCSVLFKSITANVMTFGDGGLWELLSLDEFVRVELEPQKEAIPGRYLSVSIFISLSLSICLKSEIAQRLLALWSQLHSF